MVEFVNVKMRNGEDIIAVISHDTENTITIHNPVKIEIDPNQGFFAKSWLLLAKSNAVTLDKSDILFYDDASERGIECYEEFMERITKPSDSLFEDADLESTSELEDVFTSLLESKTSTKH